MEKICRALDDAGVRFALVGGYAVALHGVPRGTIDVDLALHWPLQDLVRAEAALKHIGLTSHLPVTARDVYERRDEYIQSRNLVAWNFRNPDAPLEQVDIINYDLKGKLTQSVEMPQSTIPVLSVDDLIEMKRLSGREQDIEDAAALAKLR
ncbi:MAG: hypothetical protein OXG90_10675 [Gammaproteobacteria bacterium]|nr:hypothetical protein [Gammaproteobacteria bacterium]